jgi:hypothetical protein
MCEKEIFQSGERELKKAFEEVTTRNVLSILNYTKETRKLFRTLEEKVVNLEQGILQRDIDIDRMKKQIASLQQKLYNEGT